MNNNSSKDQNPTENGKSSNKFYWILLAVTLVLCAFWVGRQTSVSTHVNQDDSIAEVDSTDSVQTSTATEQEDANYNDPYGKNTYAKTQTANEFIGTFYVEPSKTSGRTTDRNSLTIYEDGTARYTDSIYGIYYSRRDESDENDYYWFDRELNQAEIKHTLEYYKDKEVKILKKEIKPLNKKAYSWDRLYDNRLGAVLKLTESNGNVSYISNGRWFQGYDAYSTMQAKDEEHSNEIKRVR